jgi:hypothetical protein
MTNRVIKFSTGFDILGYNKEYEETVTDEEQKILDENSVKQTIAKAWLDKLEALRIEGNSLFPARTYGVTKAKQEKNKQLAAIVERAEEQYRLWKRSLDRMEYIRKESKKKELLEEKQKQKSEKDLLAKQKVDRAIAFLLENGKKIIEDFTIESAIEVANEVKMEILTTQQSKGDASIDCPCDECSSWDGESRRCDCGNRRICWSSSGDFENMYVYAEAF